MNEIIIFGIVIVVMGLVIIAQIMERFHIVDQYAKKEDKMLEEQSRLVKAIIAKNANDYVMTTSIDKVPTETKQPTDPDMIPEESLSDDEFMASIKKQGK